MNKTILAAAGATVVALAAVVILQRESNPGLTDAPAGPLPPTGRDGANAKLASQSVDVTALLPDGADTALSEEQIARVENYLELESTRQSIQDYFDDPFEQADRAPAILDAINQLERDGRVIGFEAMHLKLSWLALNTDDEASYERQATALIEGYAARDRAAQKAFKPESIPGFSDYKAREAEIIAEVNAMDSFPQGQTRQQYLRERLLEARIAAYGEGGEGSPPR